MDRKRDKKEKSLKKKSMVLKDYFKKTHCYSEAHRQIVKQKTDAQRDYNKKLRAQNTHRDICGDLMRQRREDAAVFNGIENRRVSFLKSACDFKNEQEGLYV